MGCTTCKSSPAAHTALITRLIDYINRNDASLIIEILKMLAFEQKTQVNDLINARLIPIKDFKGSLLCYALWVGSFKVFYFLISKLDASISEMESIFYSQNLSPISILCEKNYLEILKVYLPFYLEHLNKEKTRFEQSLTISFSNSPYVVESKYHYTPIQTACVQGFVGILNFVSEYFTEEVEPDSLNIHYVEEISGENCALLSIRTGNFLMIKFLNENVKADFHVKNSRGEGAMQILAASTKVNCALQYLECVMYLIEVIKIDITYMYEETLLLLENNIIIKYFEEKLKRVGIIASKRDLESKNRIKHVADPRQTQEKSNVIGDTQEISCVVQNSVSSVFSTSFNF